MKKLRLRRTGRKNKGHRRKQISHTGTSEMGIARKLTQSYGLGDYGGKSVGMVDTSDFLQSKSYNPMTNLPDDLYRMFVRQDMLFNQAILKAKALMKATQGNPLWTNTQDYVNYYATWRISCLIKYAIQYARLGIDPTQNIKLWKEFKEKLRREQGLNIDNEKTVGLGVIKGSSAVDAITTVRAIVSNYITAFNSSLKVTNGVWSSIVPIGEIGRIDVNGIDGLKQGPIFSFLLTGTVPQNSTTQEILSRFN